ncbi:Low temperature viability protein-domain-containing protein [Polychytrium aggregatum]|uniref:Low temperature viability protein-domain-containing protein n=1 Tax=Polychytrium aggregatum TaxID=110093 RepID=UPI0022FEA8E0|nr:Low temperature viability protein-domain-containing protein [Polychytrium aggregatum]KAI9207172.1 Low temperature viability protein-domain-containing protein [Polychytrium aggregatum]
MGKKKAFIDKSKAVHFQVVHRSQRDPKLADEDASKMVLKPVAPSMNVVKKGRYDPKAIANDLASEHGEGIYYDFEASDYDSDEEELKFDDDDDYGDGDYDDDEQDDLDDDAEHAAEDDDVEQDRETGVANTSEPTADSEPAAAKKSEKKSVKAYAAPTARAAKSQSKLTDGTAASEDAAMYGITFSDMGSYDYLQHLKPMGEDPSAVYIEAKSSKKPQKKSGIQFVDEDAASEIASTARGSKRKVNFALPQDVLPSRYENAVGMLNTEAAVPMIELDPIVRDAMYALDDDAYVEDDIDDFFDLLNAEELPDEVRTELEKRGELDEEDDDYDDEYEDDDYDGSGAERYHEGDEQEASSGDWFREFQKFKKAQRNLSDDGEDGQYSDDSGTARGGPSDRKTALTNFSMTSSVMFRNKHLTLLDDRFDKVMEEYSDNEIGELDEEHPDVIGTVSISDQRLNDLMDEFLDSTEMVGKRRIVKIPGGAPLMDDIRKGLTDEVDIRKDVERVIQEDESREDNDDDIEWLRTEKEEVNDGWDAETILTTYSNVYNRPHLIKDGRVKIRMKKGFPVAIHEELQDMSLNDTAGSEQQPQTAFEQDSEQEDDAEARINKGAKRDKKETAEEKRRRKEQVKAEKQNRRMEKKSTKTAFKEEKQRQEAVAITREKAGKFIPL